MSISIIKSVPYKHTTCIPRWNERFHVVSTWNTRGAFVGFVPGCWLLLVTPVVTIYIWSVVIPRYRKNVGLWNFFCFTIFTRLFLSNRFIFYYWQYYTLRWICNKVFHEHVYYVFFSLATRFPYYIVAAFVNYTKQLKTFTILLLPF